MKLNPNEQRLGYIWFMSAGSFAVILSIFMYWTSNRVAASQGEIEHGKMLLELRNAQTSLGSGIRDPRLDAGTHSSLRVVDNENAEAADHGHDHH